MDDSTSTGYGLDYIRFDSLPSSGKGTLYLNYTSSSSTRVTTDRNYYRTSTPRISSISFVPDRDYKGTVSIPFTGTNTNGRTFSGELVIHVADGTGSNRLVETGNPEPFRSQQKLHDSYK